MSCKRNSRNIYKEGINITGSRSTHIHPPREEIEYLYVTCNQTATEIATHYKIPEYTIHYLLYTKYKINTGGIKGIASRQKKRERKLRELEEQGLTEERLRELYIEQRMPTGEIIKMYKGLSRFYIYTLLDIFGIPKRTHSESLQITWKKLTEEREQKGKSYTHRKADEIRQKIDDNIINRDSLNHVEACKLLSCNPGIERIQRMCDHCGYDFVILSNTYRKLEKIFYKMNLYPKVMVKIGLTLYIRYALTQNLIAKICGITAASIRKYYDYAKRHMKFPERRIDPLTIVNIGWIFN